METKELLKKVRKIEIKTKGLSTQAFAGSYHSAFKGRGMSFSEVRNYQYGDDVRSIDWNVTARLGQPFIKVYEEERELNVMLLIDVSNSSYFGTQTQFKNEVMAEIAAVLSFSAIQNNDKVGVIFFSDKVEKFIPPKKGKSHILLIIRELLNVNPSHKKTNLSVGLEYFNNVVKRRSIAFILSDFRTKNYEKALRVSKSKHDILGIHIYDSFEKELPKVGFIQTLDLETQEYKSIDTNSKAYRKKYHNNFHENLENNKHTFFKLNADFTSISTNENYVNALLKLFKKRRHRR